MNPIVGNADEFAFFTAVEFVVIDFVDGAQGQFAPGFDMDASFGCIKYGGVSINAAAGFDFDALRCTEIDRISLGIFMLFNFGNVFAVVPFAGFITALVESKQLSLSGIIILVAVGLQPDFTVVGADIGCTQQNAAAS